jgi:hypothetical protein
LVDYIDREWLNNRSPGHLRSGIEGQDADPVVGVVAGVFHYFIAEQGRNKGEEGNIDFLSRSMKLLSVNVLSK